VWALERFKGLFCRQDELPKVIVIDRDLALMNAVKIVFLDSHNLLCQFHIDKNVKAKCKQHVTPKKAWDQAIEVWIFVMDYPIECAYEDHLTRFEVACAP